MKLFAQGSGLRTDGPFSYDQDKWFLVREVSALNSAPLEITPRRCHGYAESKSDEQNYNA